MTFHHVLRQYPNCSEFWIDTYRNGKRVMEFAWRQHFAFSANANARSAIATAAKYEQYRNHYVKFEYFVR